MSYVNRSCCGHRANVVILEGQEPTASDRAVQKDLCYSGPNVPGKGTDEYNDGRNKQSDCGARVRLYAVASDRSDSPAWLQSQRYASAHEARCRNVSSVGQEE